jgi:hypothetical protein
LGFCAPSSCFSEEHWANGEAIGILFRVLLALSFEVRSGRLKAENFDELNIWSYSGSFTRALKAKKEGEERVIDELGKRYPEAPFHQTIISLALLKALLFDGQADKNAIRAELDRSPYYAPPGTEPAWRIAYQIWEIDDLRFEEAVAKVEEQFEKREFVIAGEMFHVFGLRLFFFCGRCNRYT